MLLAATIPCAQSDTTGSVTLTTNVLIPKPDLSLSPSDVYFNLESPVRGENVFITASVHNIGGAAANGTTVDFYVDNSHIGNRIIPELSPSKTRNISVSWKATPAGSHNITIKLDELDRIEETNETNNQASRTIHVATLPFRISLTADPRIVPADGISTSTITAQLKDRYGNEVKTSGIAIIFSTTRGTLSAASVLTDENGTAVVTLSSTTRRLALVIARSDKVMIPGITWVWFTRG